MTNFCVEPVALRGKSGFCGGHGEGGVRAAHILEAVVSAHCNCMLPGRQGRRAEAVLRDKRVAYTCARSDENPVAAVQAVLRTLDRRGCIARGEGCGMAATHFSGWQSYPEVLDHRRRVVDFEAFALAFGLECEGRRIRRRIGGYDLQVVSAVGQGGRIPRIEFLLEIVLQ